MIAIHHNIYSLSLMINQYEGACIVNNTDLTIFHLKFKLHLE